MLSSRRLVLASAALVLGLALSACGDTPRSTTPGATPPVVHIGAGAGGTAAAEASSLDRSMMPYGGFTYIYDGDLPVLAATGQAYQFPSGTTPDMNRVAAMAALLGVDGDVRPMPADQGGGWMVGPADFSAATLGVSADGLLSWWFNPDPMVASGTTGCAYPEPVLVDPMPVDSVPVDATGTNSGSASATATSVAPDSTVAGKPAGGDAPVVTVPPNTGVPCAEPPPPVNVPDKAQALQKAKELFTGLGYDVDRYAFDAYADQWSASVNAVLVVDGARTPVSLAVGFGGDGAVTWASGTLAEPAPVTQYPLVSAQDGLTRLNDQKGMWGWFGYGVTPGGVERMAADTAVAATGSSGGGTSGSGGATSNAGSEVVASDTVDAAIAPCDPAADCVHPTPIDPNQPVEPIEVHLTSVELGLTMIWDLDNTVWLLPAFVFETADQGQVTVVAVEDSYLVVDTPTVDTTPVDTTPDTTVPVDTTPGSTPDTTGTPPPDSLPAEINIDDTKDLVGLSQDEATKLAEERGWTLRVARLDGEDLAVTMDYSPTRVNVAVANGLVTEVLSIG